MASATTFQTPLRAFRHQRLRQLFFAAAVAALVLSALAVRFYRPDAPGQLVVREYRTAIIARVFYFGMQPNIPEWRREVAQVSRFREGALEPPLTEYLVALGFLVTGGENWWVGRVLTSVFWFMGALLLYRLVRFVASPEAALLPVAYFLFNPLAVSLSRSLQPDALMMLALLAALTAILIYGEGPTVRRLIIAAALSGLAVFVKPHAAFLLLGAGSAVLIHQRGWRDALGRDAFLFVALAILPSALYFGYMAVSASDWDAGMLLPGQQRSISMIEEGAMRMLLPQLFMQLSFWKDWLTLVVWAVGNAALAAGLIGLVFLPRSCYRSMLLGMWLAYPVYGVAFSARIADHGYYHAVLIPVVALSMAPLAEVVWVRLQAGRWYRSVPVIAVLVIGLLLGVLRTRVLTKPADQESAEAAREIGQIVRHSTRTVYIAKHYGRPLEYWGELSGIMWPRSTETYTWRAERKRSRSVQERLTALTEEPEYFIITDFRRFERDHQDLKTYLLESCTEVAQTEEYLIYGECEEH